MTVGNLTHQTLKGLELPVMEQFYSLQGEGYHQGKAAYFIRLAGCNVGCTWCDVKESWNAEDHNINAVEDIANALATIETNIVIVTGGEPLMYDLRALTTAIHNHRKQTHLETSGAYPITGKWDWICVSPKRFKKPLKATLKLAHELKVVIYHENDLRWAEQHARWVNPNCKLYLQPEWSKKEDITPVIFDYIKANPAWNISLQIHKYLGVR